jgi:hypothetical protein
MRKIRILFLKNPIKKHLFYWVVTILIIYTLSLFPGIVENIYSEFLYPVIALSNRWFFSFFSFSVGDILYVLMMLYLFFLLLKFVVNYKSFKNNLLALSGFLLLVVWLFYLSWGFNYFRQELAQKLELKTGNYQLKDLVKLGEILRDSTNKYQLLLTDNDTLPVEVTYGLNRIFSKTPNGYKKIENYIHQSYRFPTIKSSLLSRGISFLHVTGYLNPFTGEAQINKYYPKFALPFVASHEAAHQLGYAPEDEANFLGFLSSVNHPDPYFKYSGYSAGLYYVLIELKKYAPEKYKLILDDLHKGVRKNYMEEYRFYTKHKTKYDASKVYDSYLKLNKQKLGIKSYNQMIKLLIAYYTYEVPLLKERDSLYIIKK